MYKWVSLDVPLPWLISTTRRGVTLHLAYYTFPSARSARSWVDRA